MSIGCFMVGVVVAVLACVVQPATGPATVPTPGPAEARRMPGAEVSLELVLLVGQSNMAGRGKVGVEDGAEHPRVWMLDKGAAWVPAVDPMHFDKPEIAGVGPGLTFGRLLAEADGRAQVGMIPCAVGGTSIDEWHKGGKLYTQAVERARAAMKHGKLRAILWHQGESDSAPEKIDAYPAKLTRLLADLRADLGAEGVPVVCGELGRFRVKKAPGTERFNRMIVELTAGLPLTGCVTTEGLESTGDDTHFDAASAREMGRRYFSAFQALEAKAAKKE